MVRSRYPERGLALHARMANHQVFNADEQGMPDVQGARYVGRGDADDVGFGILRRNLGAEPAVALPPVIQAFFGRSEVKGFGHRHVVALLKQKPLRPDKDERVHLPRYHLASPQGGALNSR